MRKIADFFIFSIISICLISLPVFHAAADPVPLPAPTGLYWDGTVARWNPVDGAEKYMFYITLESETSDYSYPINPTSLTYETYFNPHNEFNLAINVFSQAEGSINARFKVKAIPADTSSFTESEYSEESDNLEYEITGYTKLCAPTNVRWHGSVAKWDPMQNVDYYQLSCSVEQGDITMAGGNTTTEENSIDVETMIYSHIRERLSGTVKITLKVKACKNAVNTLASDWTECPEPLIYNLDTKEPENIDEEKRLPVPTGLRWVGTTARWNPVENATSYSYSYSLKIPGYENAIERSDNTDKTYFDIIETIKSYIYSYGIDSGTIKASFKVRSNPSETSEYYRSSFSNDSDELNYEVTGYTKIEAPTNLRWNGTTATWNSVQNCEQYDIRLYLTPLGNANPTATLVATHMAYYTTSYDMYSEIDRIVDTFGSIGPFAFTFTVFSKPYGNTFVTSNESASSNVLLYNLDTNEITYRESDIPIDETHFPEASFRRYVSEDHIDRNQDGILSDEERTALTTLLHDEESEYRLHSLQGIEYFPNLTTIVCSWDPITEVDLSHNKSLSHLELIDCPIGTLDISACPILLAAVQVNPTRTRYEPGSWDQWDEIAGCIFIDTRTKIVAGDLVIPGSTASMATITKAPVARVLTYTGAPQELVIPGTAKDGVLGYSTEDAYLYYTGTIPTATEVGEYTIWYRAFGDDDHHHSEPRCMTARIVPATASVFEPSIPLTLTAPPRSALITDSRMLYPYSFFEMGDDWNLDVNTSPYAGSFVSVYNQEGKLQYSVYDQDHIGSFAKDARVQAFYNATGSLSEIQIEAEIITDATTNDTNFFRYVFDKDGVLTEILNEGAVIYSYDFATKAWQFVEDYVEGRTAEEYEAENDGPIDYLIQAPVNVTLNYQTLEHITLMDLTPDLVLPANTITIEDEAFAGVQNKLILISNNTTAISDIAFDPSVVILCKADSYARTWAEKNEIAYIIER